MQQNTQLLPGDTVTVNRVIRCVFCCPPVSLAADALTVAPLLQIISMESGGVDSIERPSYILPSFRVQDCMEVGKTKCDMPLEKGLPGNRRQTLLW